MRTNIVVCVATRGHTGARPSLLRGASPNRVCNVKLYPSPRSSLITSWPCISSGSSTLSGDVTRVYAHFTGGKKEPNQKTTAAAATVMHSLVDRASGVSTYSCTACYMSYTRNVSMYNNIYMYLVS